VKRLVARLDARDTLLAVPLHDSSEYVDPGNTVGHYWPMLHTVLNGGLTSQFWGRFSPQLPVGWRPGQAPLAPEDRRPWELLPQHVRAATHVLVDYPPGEDDTRIRSTRALLEREADVVAWEGTRCLYRVRKPISGPMP